MIFTTKQFRIFIGIAISSAWLLYAAFHFGVLARPQGIFWTPANSWQYPALWTVVWLGAVAVDQLGWSKGINPAFLFFLVLVVVVALLGFLPDAGQGMYWGGPSVCYATCATLAIDWVGGLLPLVAGVAMLLAEIGLREPTGRFVGWLGYTLAAVFALFIVVLFHEVTSMGVITELASGGLAASPTFFLVSYAGKGQREGSTVSLARTLRHTFVKAGIIYSILAVVYFVADIAALPLLLTPTNTVSVGSTWIIGGGGIQDGNFVYPLAAFIAYPSTYLLLRTATSAKRTWRTWSRNVPWRKGSFYGRRTGA